MSIDYEKDNKTRIPFEHYKEEYAKLDPLEASKRTQIPYDEQRKVFLMRMMGKEYEIAFPEFAVKKAEETDKEYGALTEEYAAKILAIRYLLRGAAANHTGNFKTYRDFPWGETYFRQFYGRCILRLAFGYGNKQDLFIKAMEKLNAQKIESGDVAYEFEFMNNLYVRFILWAGDEEFPPSAQILFSDNMTFAFEAEDLAVVGDISIGTIKKLS